PDRDVRRRPVPLCAARDPAGTPQARARRPRRVGTMPRIGIAVLLLALVAATAPAGDDAHASAWQPIDDAVKAAVERNELPGAVVLVLQRGKVVYLKAHGRRSEKPIPTLMTEDTVFDLASLTKPITTATAIMLLLEDGKLKLDDR